MLIIAADRRAGRTRSAALGRRSRRTWLVNALVELGSDRLRVGRLGTELQGTAPLIARLGDPAGLPVRIAEMIVDRRIFGTQLGGMLEIVARLGEIGEAVGPPAAAGDDGAVIRAPLHPAPPHAQRPREVTV